MFEIILIFDFQGYNGCVFRTVKKITWKNQKPPIILYDKEKIVYTNITSMLLQENDRFVWRKRTDNQRMYT